MSEQFQVAGTTTAVDAWSDRRLGFEPKGSMVEFRAELRAALRRLDPSPTLHAVYSSPDRRFADLENVLFYNVGGVGFSPLGTGTLTFERSFETAAKAGKVEGPGHLYRYDTTDRGWDHWTPGRLLARWEDVALPAHLTASTVWAAIRTSPTVSLHPPAAAGELALSVDVGIPAPSLSIETMKKIIDGVVAAFHAHEGNADQDLVERLAVSLKSTGEAAGRLLAMDNWDLLGRRKLIHCWGTSLQWNPADDRLVAVRYSFRNARPTISGTLCEALPVGPLSFA